MLTCSRYGPTVGVSPHRTDSRLPAVSSVRLDQKSTAPCQLLPSRQVLLSRRRNLCVYGVALFLGRFSWYASPPRKHRIAPLIPRHPARVMAKPRIRKHACHGASAALLEWNSSKKRAALCKDRCSWRRSPLISHFCRRPIEMRKRRVRLLLPRLRRRLLGHPQ